MRQCVMYLCVYTVCYPSVCIYSMLPSCVYTVYYLAVYDQYLSLPSVFDGYPQFAE